VQQSHSQVGSSECSFVCAFRLFKCRTDRVLCSDVMTHYNAVDEIF
jgi:hypothetical protein